MGERSLQAVALVERDFHGDVLATWKYPSFDEDIDSLLIPRSGLGQDDKLNEGLSFSKFGGTWIYVHTASNDGSALPRVESFAIIVTAKDFNPEKYEAMLEVMAQRYVAEGTPLKIMECFLAVITTQKIGGAFESAAHDPRHALLGGSLASVIRLFGQEAVLLWTAMVTKKRIVVYAENPSDLETITRTLPLLVWHRQNWDLLRPCLALTDLELNDLTTAGVYVAGSTDPGIKGREDMYDLYVDAPGRSISIATKAKNDFAMGKYHKGISDFLLEAASEHGDQAIIKALATRTRELITNLASQKIPRSKPSATERFLLNTAIAEGIEVELV